MSLEKTIIYDQIKKLQVNIEFDRSKQTKSHTDRRELIKDLEHIYVRYVIAANELSPACDLYRDSEICQLARRLWEIVIARASQIADELTQLSAQLNLITTEALLNLCLTPHDIQIKLPSYLFHEQSEEMKERRVEYEGVCTSVHTTREEELKSMDSDEADIFIIGTSGESVQTGQDSTFTNHSIATSPSVISKQNIFQNYTKNDITYKRNSSMIAFQVLRYERHITQRKILGMEPTGESEAFVMDKSGEERNRIIRNEREKDIEAKFSAVHDKVFKTPTGRIEEDIKEELRVWYLDWVDKTGEYPVLPPAVPVPAGCKIYGIPSKLSKKWVAENYPNFLTLPKEEYIQQLLGVRSLTGSALITNEDWINTNDYLKCKAAVAESRKEKDGAGRAKKARTGEKKSELEYTLKPTVFFSCFENIIEDFNIEQCNRETYRDPIERHEILFTKNAMMDLHLQIRLDVDKEINEELIQLDKAYKRDNGQKHKNKPKNKKAKIKKSKVIKTLDDYEEIVRDFARKGICKFGEGKTFDDYIDCDLQPEKVNILTRLCVLPLLCSTVRYLAPLTRSVCLVGPPGIGKKTLLDAVVTETAAFLFDLSPKKIGGYLSTKQDTQLFLRHLNTLLQRCQPCVILVEEAEKVFYKKAPKSDKNLNLAKCNLLLKKILNAIKVNNRVMIIATSSEPWLAKKTFNKFFDVLVPVEIADYDMYNQAWARYLSAANLSLETLPFAKLTHRLTSQFTTIPNILEEVNYIEANRKCEQILKALAADKSGLSLTNPKLATFLNKTPLAKKLIKIQATEANKELKGNKKKPKTAA